jgi:hypothetical protein
MHRVYKGRSKEAESGRGKSEITNRVWSGLFLGINFIRSAAVVRRDEEELLIFSACRGLTRFIGPNAFLDRGCQSSDLLQSTLTARLAM